MGWVLFMTGLKSHDIKKCLYCKTTASSRFFTRDSTEITPRLESDFAKRNYKMPKSFLVKKRVAIGTCKESQDLPDAEIKHEPGKLLGI